jgi:Uma2 family endonuclease
MTVAKSSLALENFLKLPETEPASEYIDGKIIQKPMPKTRHSRLQGKLVTNINEVTEDKEIAYAFPELRCTFQGRSIVPDVVVLRWENIRFDDNGVEKSKPELYEKIIVIAIINRNISTFLKSQLNTSNLKDASQ